MHARALRTETRMDAAEIDLLDQENALLELEDIVVRVRAMADVTRLGSIPRTRWASPTSAAPAATATSVVVSVAPPKTSASSVMR